MVALDTSLLAYGINRFAPEHPRAARVLEDLANGDLPWALPWPVVHEFLGFVTHPHAVARPLKPGDAWAFVERLLVSPSLAMLSPTGHHAAVLGETLASVSPEPGPSSGLETAVILREHGVRELLSADRGMRRFAFLTVHDPIHGEPWPSEARPARRYRVLRARPARG
jgi:predicted nucleic acid-binding protein